MSKMLSPAMTNLLEAMQRGVRVHFMGGLYAYYFRSDTMRPCTRQAEALISRGLVRRIGEGTTCVLELVGGSDA